MTANVYTSDVTVDSATPAQLAESIRLREERLTDNIDELVGRLHPRALLTRAANEVKSTVIDEDGAPKTEAIALGVGAALGIAALVVGFSGRG